MMIDFIPIYKKDSLKSKIEIYHWIIKVIIKSMFKFFLLYIVIWLGIT